MFPALMLLAALPVCRYTVRDIGFVDLVGAEYSLAYAAPKDAALTAEGRALLGALVRDGNVASVEAAEGAPMGWSLVREGLEPLDLQLTGRDDAAARAAWNAAVHSPLRDRLLAEALGTFATILRVPGTDEAEEARVAEVLAAGHAGLKVLEATLPRPIDRPLRELELGRDQREAERVLLWSLGLGIDQEEPAVAVLYGRGKLIGRVMVGAAITEHELLAQLALVGESCECDTSRDWFNEPRVPLAWTDRQRARAASELGFDPESPMVKSEVVRILERGPLTGGAPREGEPDGIEALVFGYRELELDEGGAPAPERDFEPDGAASSAAVPGRVIEATPEDDWGFDEDGGDDGGDGGNDGGNDGAVIIDPSPDYESSAISYGGGGSRSSYVGRNALLILGGVVLGSFLTWILVGSLRRRDA